MDYNKIFDIAKNKNMDIIEIFTSRSEELSISVYNGNIEKYNIADSKGSSLRGKIDGKTGFVFTEDLENEDVDRLLNVLIENASVIEKEYEDAFNNDNLNLSEDTYYNEKLFETEPNKKIDLLIEIEKKLLAYDKRITQADYCMYSETKETLSLFNSSGLKINKVNSFGYIYVSIIANEGTDTKTAGKFQIVKDIETFDIDKFVSELAMDALDRLGAKPVTSGDYNVIIKNKAFADLLSAMLPCINGQNIIDKVSRLSDSLGKKIACDKLNLIDDPTLEEGLFSSAVDGEGVKTFKKDVIKDGVLKTFLHNLTTAKKLNQSASGNGHRSSYQSNVGIAPTNLYIEKGVKSFTEMVEMTGDGVIIDEFMGLHAGLDVPSGTFSLQCTGFVIENGKAGRAINNITTSGNFFDLLNKINTIGNDLEFTIPSSSYVGSPSILFNNIHISGE